MMPDVLTTPPGPSPPPSPATSRVSHGSRYVPERTGRLARRARRRAGSRRAGPGHARREMTSWPGQEALYDAGWMRWGWPERAGGLGGSAILRAYLGEALMARGLVEAGRLLDDRVLAPTMIDFAPPELASRFVPPLLRGDVMWCQGFLRARDRQQPGRAAVPGDRTGDGWGSPARRCGRATPSTPSTACCSPAPAARVAPRGITACSSTWTAPESPSARCAPWTASRSSARSSTTTSRSPASA